MSEIITILESAPAPRGTYFAMRRQSDGLLKGAQFTSAKLSNNPALVAAYNKQYGGAWAFVVLSKAGYDTVKGIFGKLQRAYMDDPAVMSFRAEGLPVSPRLLEIQAQQAANYRRRKLTDFKLDKITNRKIEPIKLYQ